MIPKVLHFVWIGGEMPAFAARNIAAFRRLNPDYAVQVHDETSLRPSWSARYDQCVHLSSRADLILRGR